MRFRRSGSTCLIVFHTFGSGFGAEDHEFLKARVYLSGAVMATLDTDELESVGGQKLLADAKYAGAGLANGLEKYSKLHAIAGKSGGAYEHEVQQFEAHLEDFACDEYGADEEHSKEIKELKARAKRERDNVDEKIKQA